VVHSEPKVVAGHVRKREDKNVALVPPPPSKKSKLSGGGEKEGGGENERDRAGSRKSGDDGQEGGDEPDPVDVKNADDGAVTDEEYESALEDPWPEEVWNDSPPMLTRAPPSAVSAAEMELGLLGEEEDKWLRGNYAAYREKYRLLAYGNGYESTYRLCARGRQVWRLEGYNLSVLLHIESWEEFQATEAWQTRVESMSKCWTKRGGSGKRIDNVGLF
jgi:hypothetical protein